MTFKYFLNPYLNVWFTIIALYSTGWLFDNSLFYQFGKLLLIFKLLDLVLDISINIWTYIQGKLHD